MSERTKSTAQEINFTLEQARKYAGKTQSESAIVVGVDVGTIRSWEKGETEPKVSQAKKLCNFYGVDIDRINFLPVNSL